MKVEIIKVLDSSISSISLQVGDYTTTEELEEQGLLHLVEYKPQQDWKGNTQSVMATLNASSHSKEEREQHDYYATPPLAVNALIDSLQGKLSRHILEPACGEGHISKIMESRGFKVLSSDLIDRGYGSTLDFLSENMLDSWHGDIVTNPPYSLANEFLLKALSIIRPGQKVCFFLRIQYLEGVARHKIYEQHPPKYIYVSSRSIRCAKNGDFANATGNASTYCWFIWEKGFKGDPAIRWFNF